MRAVNENCDDGNLILNDGCSNCLIDHGFLCSGTEPDVCQSTCGDGIKASNEVCDDGNLVNLDGCSGCTFDTNYICNMTVEPNICDICGNN